MTVHVKVVPAEGRGYADMRFRLDSKGNTLPGSPVYDLQPDQHGHELVLEVSDGQHVLAR